MIERQDTGGIRILKLAHGKVSAMDLELGEAFTREMHDAAVAPVKAVIVTGTGSAFSAGVDLFRVRERRAGVRTAFLPVLDGFLRAALTLPKPMVAAVNGHAIAGGCILAACCDHRIMVDGTGRIGVPELGSASPSPRCRCRLWPLALPTRRCVTWCLRPGPFKSMKPRHWG